MNREIKLIKNTIILGLGTLLPKLAQFITLPIYTAALTKSEYGTYDIVLILASLLVPVITLQIERAAFRYLISEKETETKDLIITNLYMFIIPIAIIASVFTFIVLNYYGISKAINMLISLYLFVDVNVIAVGQISRGLGKNKAYSNSAIINSLINVILVILLLYVFDTGLKGLLISLNISLLCSFFYLMQHISLLKRINLKLFRLDHMRLMLKYSIPMIPNSISLWIIQASDRLVITSVLGIEANAIYAVSNKIPSLFALAYNTFNMAWQESASMAYTDEDVDLYYSEIFNSLFDFLAGIMAILIGFTPLLFSILIKGEYDKAYYQMPILFLGIFFSSLSAYYGGIYIALKETKKIGISSLIGAIMNLLINMVLIKRIGLYAASLSTLISYLVLTSYRLIDIEKFINISYKWNKIIGSLIILTVMSVICYQKNLHLNILNMALGIIVTFILNKNLILKLYYLCANKVKNDV